MASGPGLGDQLPGCLRQLMTRTVCPQVRADLTAGGRGDEDDDNGGWVVIGQNRFGRVMASASAVERRDEGSGLADGRHRHGVDQTGSMKKVI
jgi:hypothetical protein